MQIVRLAGQIADGVLLDFLVPVEYNQKAMEEIRRRASESGRSFEQIDRPQYILCSVNNEDPREAVDE